MTNLTLAVDKSHATPAYLQLKEQLTGAIEKGLLAPGQALPSERELAALLKLSRMTVRHALLELASDNLVEQRQGSGTYVLPRRLLQTVDRVLGFTDEARDLGFIPGNHLLEAELIAADQQIAGNLGVDKGDEVMCITRLRTANDEPLVIQVAFLSPRLEAFPVERLRREGSLYKVFATHYGIELQRAHQTISARLPTRQEQQLLTISRDTPILALERTTFDAHGQPIEYVRSAYRSDKYQIALDLRKL
ncbi:MAG: GntR family transcriptional regulator [Truepera sp.]|nr:GntR family transcriptional regulator [Truepera sp.]